METQQDWGAAYKELCDVLKNDAQPAKGVEEIKHIDLWHEQTNYMADEYPFPEHSVFLDFKAVSIENNSLLVQDINFNVTVYYILDTLSESFQGSDNQDLSLEFIRVCKKINNKLHGLVGENFSEMSRIGMGSVPAPEYQIVYTQTYSTIIRDMSAMAERGEATVKKVTTNKVTTPASGSFDMYQIPE